MGTQKIVNLLNDSDNENSKFATKNWYDIDSESKDNYSHENQIKFLTSSLESNLWNYSDAYILFKEILQQHPKMQLHKKYLKIVHHLKIVEQKLTTFLLIMQIFLILLCLFKI